MKKKFLSFVLAICLIIPCALMLTACGGGNPHTNAEFDEFKTIITSVLDTYKFEESSASAQTLSNAKLMSAMATPMSLTQNDRTDLLNMINSDSNKTQVNANYYYQDAFEQSFYMPLICGEVYAYTLEKDNFYGEKMLMETNNQYMMVESSGTHKYIYCYTPAGTIYDENHFDVLDLNYVSSNDYEFTMIGFNSDYSQVTYIYGDESKSIIVVSKDTNGDSESNFVVATLGGTAYESQSDSILTSAFNLISSEVQSQDKTKIQSTATGYTTISNDAYEEAMNKYFGDNNDQQQISIDWDCSNDFVYGYYGSDTEITIPSNITSISSYFQVASNVTKLTIPASITSIKSGEMDQPISAENLFKGFEWQIDSVTEIVVESGSTLFEVKDGNLYTKSGQLLCVVNNQTITDLEISDTGITEQVIRKIGQLPNLKNLTYECGVYVGHGYENDLNGIFITQTKNDFALETVTFKNLNNESSSINLTFANKVVSIQTLNLSVKDGGNVYISGNVTIGQINVDANTTLIDNR